MHRRYVCSRCGQQTAVTLDRLLCDCGGPLDLAPCHDLRSLCTPARSWNAQRYGALLPADPAALAAANLGAGQTPLIETAPGSSVWLKCDQLNPTGSFKDRGAVVLAALAVELRATRIVLDSSGNAGAAMAAHAARVGLPCEVYVPAGTSPVKVGQARSYGARVIRVRGGRAPAAAAARAAAARSGTCYASHALNPHFQHGTKTWAYEVWEQLGSTPDVVVVPAGSGTLLLGAALGFAELRAAGLVARVPRMIAVQAAGCAPLSGKVAGPRRQSATPFAEGIAIAAPVRLQQMRDALTDSRGWAEVVTDRQVRDAQLDLARTGFHVEPTGAAAWAGWIASRGRWRRRPTVVVALTGSGMKTPADTDRTARRQEAAP